MSLTERLDAALAMLRVALTVTVGTVGLFALAYALTRWIEASARRSASRADRPLERGTR